MAWRRGKSYAQDLRDRVFVAADDGEPVGRIATMLRVSVSYVSKVLTRRRLTGETTARPQRCHVAPRAIRNCAREVECEIGASKIGLPKQAGKGPRTSIPSTRSHLCA